MVDSNRRIELGRDIADVVERLILERDDILRSLAPFGQYATRLSEDVRRMSEEMRPTIERLIGIRTELQQSFGSILQEIAERFRELPTYNNRAARVLAKHGWYIDPNLSPRDSFEAAALFEGGDVANANEELCAHYEAEAPRMLEDLIKQLPARERLLRSAFVAHDRGDYACSIPLILIQADGVCHDFCGEQLYGRRNGVPRLATVLEGFEEGFFISSLIGPLIEPTPLSASREERAALPSGILNRHVILHGESTDYDIRLNSCRAISLLVYVAWILDRRPTAQDSETPA